MRGDFIPFRTYTFTAHQPLYSRTDLVNTSTLLFKNTPWQPAMRQSNGTGNGGAEVHLDRDRSL